MLLTITYLTKSNEKKTIDLEIEDRNDVFIPNIKDIINQMLSIKDVAEVIDIDYDMIFEEDDFDD